MIRRIVSNLKRLWLFWMYGKKFAEDVATKVMMKSPQETSEYCKAMNLGNESITFDIDSGLKIRIFITLMKSKFS